MRRRLQWSRNGRGRWREPGFLTAPASGTQVVWAADVTQANAGAFQTLTVNMSASTVETVGVYTVP